jgi:hypothetical protein
MQSSGTRYLSTSNVDEAGFARAEFRAQASSPEPVSSAWLRAVQ